MMKVIRRILKLWSIEIYSCLYDYIVLVVVIITIIILLTLKSLSSSPFAGYLKLHTRKEHVSTVYIIIAIL